MREKAEQGIYPGRAPFGYRNDKQSRTIEVDSQNARILRGIFELYATGHHSLSSLRRAVLIETGKRFSRSYLETMLKNHFYLGYFTWQGVEYKGSHAPLVEPQLFDRVQRIFSGHNKPKYRKHDFAFAGLLTCAHDGCRVTTELHKGKYVYYRCSYGHGKCELPYMREQEVSDSLGTLLDQIYVPEGVARQIVDSLRSDTDRLETQRIERANCIRQRLAGLRTRMDQMYEDKLDRKINEEFWTRKMAEWRDQERALETALASLNQPVTSANVLTAERIFELANKARFLYVTRNAPERGQLLRMVLLNCATDGASLWPTYRKPFDLIFHRAKTEEWSGREDLNLRPPGPEPVKSMLCC
ncbi:MAG: recombinase family protein [Acidobacteria bacterium]|nr:recombinase family protein [Acidobacteriota bacterium]